MKKTLAQAPRATSHRLDESAGEGYSNILGYFFPELITSLLLYMALNFIDSRLIAYSQETATYAASGIIQQLFHFLTKIAEGLSIGTIIVCGQSNGAAQYKQAGRFLIDSFWITFFMGGLIALCLYLTAYWIYVFSGLPVEVMSLGVSYLRLRALTVFLSFVFFALIGFMRGIKNTKAPMFLFMSGGVVFVFFDYALILGQWGFPHLGFQGSAWASVLQYCFMLSGALIYLLYNGNMQKYALSLASFSHISWNNSIELLRVSWPVMLDKGMLAGCHLWLSCMMCKLAAAIGSQTGTIVLASFTAIKDLERLAIIPGLAFAQVITFLVSNDSYVHNWLGITNNIKKVLILSHSMVAGILALFSLYPYLFLSFFDKQQVFSMFAAAAIPMLSILVFFDLGQLILSGALRGSANVKIVMLVRVVVTLGYFLPVSWFITHLTISNPLVHFVLLYGSLYIGNALMTAVYLYYFKTEKWKKFALQA